MTAVLLVVRAAVRRQWRSLLVVMVLIGIAGSFVLAAAAGARRTASGIRALRTMVRGLGHGAGAQRGET